MLDKTMRRRFLLSVPLAWAAASSQVLAAPDAQALLRASDAVRNPGRPFSVRVTLIEFESGKQVDSSVLTSYSRADDATGQFASLVRFVQPVRDAGKLILRSGDDMWFFDPGSKASVRLSPQQRLMGQASNGDVVTVNFAKDYRAEWQAEEDVQDGERKTRRAHKLALTATAASASYPRVELWVDVLSSQPIKGRFFAESGKLLKSVYYRKFETQLGRERPTEMVIIDGLNPRSVTLMQYSQFATPNIPWSWFQRDNLSRFQPEQ